MIETDTGLDIKITSKKKNSTTSLCGARYMKTKDKHCTRDRERRGREREREGEGDRQRKRKKRNN